MNSLKFYDFHFFNFSFRVWVNIVNNGKFERIAAYEGESLLQALLNHKVDGVPGLQK